MMCIINADDLGLSQEVNDTIRDSFSRGTITSSIILANTTLWDDVCDIVLIDHRTDVPSRRREIQGRDASCGRTNCWAFVE